MRRVSPAVAALPRPDGDHVAAKPHRRVGKIVGISPPVRARSRRLTRVRATAAAVRRVRRALRSAFLGLSNKMASVAETGSARPIPADVKQKPV